MGLAFTMAASVTLSGCSTGKKDSGKTEIELVQYKPEAVKAFEKLEEKFNATHDDIHLTIESPNDAMTVLKTIRISLESEAMLTFPILLILIC